MQLKARIPKTNKDGSPKKSELPDTLKKSSAKARRTYAETHNSAAQEYGEGERANRTAYAALKHSFEKVGAHWEEKSQKGPSDEKAASGRRSDGRTHGGVDANASKQHLYDVAKHLDVVGRSTMTKQQLVDAIEKANQKKTRDE